MTPPATQRYEPAGDDRGAPLRLCLAGPESEEPSPTHPADVAQVHVPCTGWSEITILVKLHRGERTNEHQD
jgi:hypothetical protein